MKCQVEGCNKPSVKALTLELKKIRDSRDQPLTIKVWLCSDHFLDFIYYGNWSKPE